MSIDSINTGNITEVHKPDLQNQSSQIQTATKPYPNDTVEISATKTKKKQSKLKKIAIGVGTGFAALAGVAILFAKHQNNKLSKLYKDKLVLSNLAEKIDFKEATTLEEAIKFTKETLGIKDVDKNFTLDALNIANKGLVEVSNANKGKLFMPPALRFEVPTGDREYIAYVVRNVESKEFGNLVINKNYFEHSFLDKELKECLYSEKGEKLFNFLPNNKISTQYFIGGAFAVPDKNLSKLITEYYKNPSSVSISDKQKLFYSFMEGDTRACRKIRSPLEALTKLKESDKEFLEKNNIAINLEELSHKTTKEQSQYLQNIIQKMLDNKIQKTTAYKLESPTSTIHHEMGHLQDFAKNLKELDLKQWKFSWKEAWENSKQKVKTGEDNNRIGIEEVDNRWGAISKENIKKLFDEKPDKFKKLYPELHEFLTNQEIQQTVGKVSDYAQVGIGEFIAETYAKMIAKKKLPDDVIALYKKYNGPEIPA